ncbi:PilZ domain-containing protein [Sphingopyxis sp.]|uniref:PilZ domain-containing protein n=1 Tax=Sphingopyxis sp. TaxID=1908224 RepID=UPI002637626A|nr:PilZ domain-containing protein [Sphingopyxis sp.]MCW0199254.1 PilZ domain-containing protein [Sphingopyxis sp.]
MGRRTVQTTTNGNKASQARRAERAPVCGRARFREPGFNPFDVELFDLSSTGFRMVTFARPQIGKHIWVNLPGLQQLEAVVRRADGNNFGCEFVHPLHPSVAKHLQVKLR